MSYAEITFNDPNPLKRWLQQSRLTSAMKLCRQALPPQRSHVICDFGAGNGELLKLIASEYLDSQLICYEPSPLLLAEARHNLGAIRHTEFCADIATLTPGLADVVFCLEVFEHLPHEETVRALDAIHHLLRPGGIAIIGVPIEIGVPALYKGLFRMARRYGAFDARLNNILRALLGYPPTNRPVAEIAPGLNFHFEHMGFDFRQLKLAVGTTLKLKTATASPIAALGSWFMPEIYFVAEKPAAPTG